MRAGQCCSGNVKVAVLAAQLACMGGRPGLRSRAAGSREKGEARAGKCWKSLPLTPSTRAWMVAPARAAAGLRQSDFSGNNMTASPGLSPRCLHALFGSASSALSPAPPPLLAVALSSPSLPPTTSFPPPPPLLRTSMYFLALSHAPPVLDMLMASCTPLTRDPVSMPARAWVPKRVPMTMGDSMTRAPGGIISDREDSVEMATHLDVCG